MIRYRYDVDAKSTIVLCPSCMTHKKLLSLSPGDVQTITCACGATLRVHAHQEAGTFDVRREN